MHIRPTTVQDAPALAAIISSQSPEPTTAESLLRDDALRSATDPYIRLGAFDDAGQLMGFVFAWHAQDMAPGEFFPRVRVAAAHQSKGVGRALWQDALAWLKEQGATSIISGVMEADKRSTRIAQEAGFRITYQLFESTLSLADWDSTPWLDQVARAEASGIRFTTQAEWSTTPDAMRPLWEVSTRLELDIPSNEHRTPLPFETWYRLQVGNPHYSADGVHLALDGERIVGVSTILGMDSGAVINDFTGVDRAYRGRGIALALKVKGINWAKTTGAPYIRTANHSINKPMLAVNHKLGYKPEPGRFQVKMEL